MSFFKELIKMKTLRKNISMINASTGISLKVECELFATFVASITVNAGTITAYATDDDDNATVIMAFNTTDWTSSSSISTTGKYEFSITGMKEFYFVSTANATIKGRMLT
jgi:hypothetical protein